MASRRKGRILAFQALYAWDLSGNLPTDNNSAGNSEEKAPDNEELPEFSQLLIAGTIENIAAIDTMIRKHLENWDFSRLNRVDLAVLRISVYALMYQADTAPSIIINEAIGISKEFGTDDSYRFINGVLDGIRKSLGNQSGPKTG
jgi:N utilization substance protein B